jgi:hypothetical protein
MEYLKITPEKNDWKSLYVDLQTFFMIGYDASYVARDGETALSILVTKNNLLVQPQIISFFSELIGMEEFQRCFVLFMRHYKQLYDKKDKIVDREPEVNEFLSCGADIDVEVL